MPSTSYTVKSGDNLSSIAQRYGVPLSSIRGFSSGNPNLIKPGEKLSFAAPASTKSSNFTPKPFSSAPKLVQNFAPAPKASFATTASMAPKNILEYNKTLNQAQQKPQMQEQPQWAQQEAQKITAPKPEVQFKAQPFQQPSSPTETQATTQAIKSGANPGLLERAKQFLGRQEYIGLCQAFVERATKGREGLFDSAIDAWNKQQNKAQTDMSRIKPGDAIYFAPDASNGWYGHTGVYAGNGQFISATYNGIKQSDLNEWIKSTGQKLLGFISEGESEGGGPTEWVQQKMEEVGNMVTPKAYADSGVSSPSYVQGTPDWIQPIIAKAAKKHNIPPIMLSALLKKESGFNPEAKSPVGAVGIAQFMPATAQEMGIDPYDPEQAIDGAARYLRQQWDKFGKPDLALAAYNSGAGNVQSFGGIPPFKETRDYVKAIMDMAGQVHQTAYDPMLKLALGGPTMKSSSASLR